jgi:2-oxoglutarate ferredoxin oxidoreductase subunit gamma
VIERLIVAGFGGQGVVFLGRLLAHAMMHEGKNVTFLPAYGPEVRGGWANCHVVISSGEIYSPSVTHPTALLAMNQISWDHFARQLEPDGLAVVNASMAQAAAATPSQRIIPVAATDIAKELGDVRATNMVMLGAYNHARGLLALDALLGHLRTALGPQKAALFELNRQAVQRGMEAAAAAPPAAS